MPGNGHIQFPFLEFALRECRGFLTKFLEFAWVLLASDTRRLRQV
jgi:hypothetical protein